MRAFWRATLRDVVVAFHAYERRRAWLAWHSGLVANGSVKSFDQLLPDRRADAEAAAAERGAVKNEHAFLTWYALVGGFDEKE